MPAAMPSTSRSWRRDLGGNPCGVAELAVTPEPRWYARPVFFVTDLDRALRFYVDQLGFWKKWHEGDGEGTVCQVNRGDCEIILCQHPTRRDKGRLFVELNAAGFLELCRELAERSVPTREIWWGYDSLLLEDPDGNELIVPTEGMDHGGSDSVPA